MAHIVADRVRDTTTTTGTGAVTVSGTPPATYKTFSARMTSPSDTCAYFIAHRTADEWECGIGTYSASNTLTRTTVLSSSNSDAVVSLSAGTKDVVLTQIADRGFFPTALVASQGSQSSGDYRIRSMGAFTTVGININNGGGVAIGGDGAGDSVVINDALAFIRQRGATWGGVYSPTTQINQQGTSNTSGIVSFESTTIPQSIRVYNTTDGGASPTNYERGVFDWTTNTNVLTIGVQAAGTGNPARPVFVQGGSVTQSHPASGVKVTFSGGNLFYPETDNTVDLGYAAGGFNWKSVNTVLGMRICPAGGAPDTGMFRNAAGVVEINNGTAGTYKNLRLATLWRAAPITKTADFTVGADEYSFINNKTASACTVTLPTASSFTGREILITNYQTQTVISASSNVIPAIGGSAGTAILAATTGKWAKLVSNGTNWVIMASN